MKDEAVKRAAFAHWKVLHPSDVSETPQELWVNLGAKQQQAYLAALAALRPGDEWLNEQYGEPFRVVASTEKGLQT